MVRSVRSRRGRGGRARGRGRGINRTRNSVRVGRLVRGQHYQPAADPPQFTSIPWNQVNLVVSVKMEADKRKTVDVETIQKAMVQQLGLYATNVNTDPLPLEFRIDDLRFYNLTGQSIQVEIFDWQKLSPDISKTETAAVLSDVPAENHWARVGYKPAAADSSEPFHNGANLLFAILVPATSTVACYLRVLWRTFHGIPTVSASKLSIDEIIPGLPTVNTTQDQLLASILKTLQDKIVLTDT